MNPRSARSKDSAPAQQNLDTASSGRFLGVSGRTLEAWRSQGKGPPYVRLHGRIVYRLRDLEAWLEARVVDPAEPPR